LLWQQRWRPHYFGSGTENFFVKAAFGVGLQLEMLYPVS